MRILFHPFRCLPFPPDILSASALGGTETGIIHLSEALTKLGHEVYVITDLYPSLHHKPSYLTEREATALGHMDAVIIVRGWQAVMSRIKRKRTLFWSGDAAWSLFSYGIGDPRIKQLYDAFLFVSDWQAADYVAKAGIPKEKVRILRNGVKLSNFEGTENRLRRRLIYSSIVERGLINLPLIYAALKKKYPDLELHIFSNSSPYSRDDTHRLVPGEKTHALFAELLNICQALPNVTVHGTVTQSRLAREFMKSSVLVYPTAFEETSCITAMEAQAAGCPIVTSKLAALPETIGEAGILIQGRAGDPEYNRQFQEALDSLLTDDDLWKKYSQAGLEQAKYFDWQQRAEHLIHLIKELE